MRAVCIRCQEPVRGVRRPGDTHKGHRRVTLDKTCGRWGWIDVDAARETSLDKTNEAYWVKRYEQTVAERDRLTEDKERILSFFGATENDEGGLTLNMRKYHAAYRCGKHRADDYQRQEGLDECNACLRAEMAAIRKARGE